MIKCKMQLETEEIEDTAEEKQLPLPFQEAK